MTEERSEQKRRRPEWRSSSDSIESEESSEPGNSISEDPAGDAQPGLFDEPIVFVEAADWARKVVSKDDARAWRLKRILKGDVAWPNLVRAQMKDADAYARHERGLWCKLAQEEGLELGLNSGHVIMPFPIEFEVPAATMRAVCRKPEEYTADAIDLMVRMQHMQFAQIRESLAAAREPRLVFGCRYDVIMPRIREALAAAHFTVIEHNESFVLERDKSFVLEAPKEK
ncbi:MAG TPA: hypothetical protein VKD22_05430 [Ramlibacter sp.]|nr:hypothetical protein [Ramlibacter sp.]